MSGYYSDDDPHRTSGGQFTNHVNATLDQQRAAGVNDSDSYMDAHLKTDAYRRAYGLDISTGAPLSQTNAGGCSGGGFHVQGPGVLGGLFKYLIFWPAVIAAIVIAPVMVARSIEAPTLANDAAQDFAAYEPPPLSKLFPEKALAKPVKPAALVVALRSYRPSKDAKADLARRIPILGQAYRCNLQPGCEDEVIRLLPVITSQISMASRMFLAELARSGNEDAMREFCLFGMRSAHSYGEIVLARNRCQWMNAENRHSAAGAEAMALIDNSWKVRRARLYVAADEMEYRLTH